MRFDRKRRDREKPKSGGQSQDAHSTQHNMPLEEANKKLTFTVMNI